MCGITAVFGRGDVAEVARRMHAPIRHRGPDAEGFAAFPNAALAFRRLKIVDLSEAAAQPMQRGDRWLVFNGEIYNYRELRAELRALGHEFRSDGDAEVILAAHEQWGVDCLTRLQGMWAFVLIDVARRSVLVSRDRLGIKPLYWQRHDGKILFASEARQIIAANGRAEANLPLVIRHIRGDRTPCYDETFFRGIQMVPSASFCEFSLDDDRDPEFKPFWRLSDVVAHPLPYDDARERLRALLDETVDSHRHADVKTGCLLSGGLDSSVLTALMADDLAAEGDEVETFSFGFRDRAPRFCEMRYVDAIARGRRNIVNHETTFDAGWVANHVGRVVSSLEEPSLSMAALAQWRVFELVRERGTTVVLDGEGSDEIFAGYPPYQRMLLADYARAGQFGSVARELAAMAQWNDQTVPGVVANMLLPPLRNRIAGPKFPWVTAERPAITNHIDRSADPSRVNRSLYHAVRWGNVKIVLYYTDKASMAHSVEARVPYMDHRVVELAFSLPAPHKVGQGMRKRVLRDIGKTLLPAEVTDRRDRMGFGTPEEQFLREPALASSVRERLTDPSFLGMSMLDAGEVRKLVDRFMSGEERDFRSVWRLYTLAVWQSEFAVKGLS